MTAIEKLILKTRCEHILFWTESLARSVAVPDIDILTSVTMQQIRREIQHLEKIIEVMQ